MSGEGERASRPNSLLLETPGPEREPLRFDVQLVGAPPEVEQLVNNIKQVAEDFLYHWKTFPIVLPPSRFTGPDSRPSDIIIAPPCDELDAAALDAGIEPHPLTAKQLHSIREKGEFEVPSRHFPGQTHVWRVAGWLQRGRARAREELYCHVARAVALIVVVSRDRLLRDEPLSVIAGAKAFVEGFQRLIDLVFGLPSLEARDLEKKIREERSRYLVAELICKTEDQEDISSLAAWVCRGMRRAAAEKTDAREASRHTPRVPCLYTTPQRTQVDLRLYRRDLLRRASPSLQTILERESRGWFLHFRERTAALLASQKMPIKDIEEAVSAAAMQQYVSRVCASARGCAALRALGGGVAALLADQLRAAHVRARAEAGVRRRLEAGLHSAEARLVAAHSVLSRAGAWRRERLAAAAAALRRDLRWSAMEDAARDLHAHKLHQHRYFLLRDLAFLRDREPLLLKELRAAKTPTREFTWATRIWFPHNWTIIRHFRGRSERIPTIISGRATNIVTPRSDPSQPVFLADREHIRTTTTRWPFWRLLNLAHRSWCWTWNMMFVLGVLVPWCSPLSLRTLISVKPFVPDLELSQVNGTLFPKRSSETQTMWSKLLKLWRHVSKERTRFETEPDTGLLGKGLSRQAHRLWNYGLVGGCGSLALLLAFPLAALAASALALAAAATVPLWTPPLAALLHVLNALLFDLDCPDPPGLNRCDSRLGGTVLPPEYRIQCVLLLQVVRAVRGLDMARRSAGRGSADTGIRSCRVCMSTHGSHSTCRRSELVVRARAVGGGVLARPAGAGRPGAGPRLPLLPPRGRPGAAVARLLPDHVTIPTHPLDRTTYRLLTPPPHPRASQALAAVCARGELEVLSAWAADLEEAIERPLRDYAHFVDACFGPFAVQIAKTGSYKQLEKECSELVFSLREKVSTRRRELSLGLSDAARARVRMEAQDLRNAVHLSAVELSRVMGETASRADDWWTTRGLEPADWHALAANMLVEVFDAEILVALEESEARVALEAGAAAGRWGRGAREHAPPDVLAERDDWGPAPGVWRDWRGSPAPRVPPPLLDAACFSPRAPSLPPLPSPAAVALVLHNRESDNPIPLDSELCIEILKTLEDAPDCDDRRDGVERYRGGGSATSDTSGSDTPDHSAPECRVPGGPPRAACRWTLTGRGVRLRADLASPDDDDDDAARHQGTSV